MRKRARTIVYVCSVIKENILLSKAIDADSIDESCLVFEKEYNVKPESILGPFYKKKTGVLEKNCNIQFKFGQNKQGIYNGWHITALPLLNPLDSVYLLYNKRVDGQKSQKPQSTVVKIKEIQELK